MAQHVRSRHQLRLAVALALAHSCSGVLDMGVNMNELSAWQNLWPFTDLFKHSTPFQARRLDNSGAFLWERGEYVTLRADGYPASLALASTVAEATIGMAPLINSNPADLPVAPTYTPGAYVLLWEGNGTLRLDGDASGAWNSSSGGNGGRATVTVLTRVGIIVRILRTDVSNPVRNIRIVPQALESSYNTTAIWTPHWLALASRYRAIRFTGAQGMSFASTAQQVPFTWASRPTPSSATQAGPFGMALEYALSLAAAVNASAWINVPGPATSDFIASFAAWLVPAVVSTAASTPGWTGRVYLEYSTTLGYNQPQAAAMYALQDNVTSAIAAATSTSPAAAALRARFRFAAVAGFQSFMLTDYATAPGAVPNAHPFARMDVLAFPVALGSEMNLDSPSTNLSMWLTASDADIIARLRRSVLDAEVGLTRMRNQVTFWRVNTNASISLPVTLEPVIFSGGFVLSAPAYGARYTLAITPVANRTAAMIAAASVEQAAQDRMNSISRLPAITDLLLDHWRRYDANGGGLYFVSDVMRPASPSQMWGFRKAGNDAMCEGWQVGYPALLSNSVSSSTSPQLTASLVVNGAAAPVAAQLLAGDAATVTKLVSAVIAASPKLRAVEAYLAGNRSALAFTSADLPQVPAPVCTPACVYGTCYNGSCVCWAGATGATCATLGAPVGAAACGAPRIGMNLAGLADWSTQLVYVNIHKQSRAFIPQVGWQDFGASGWTYGSLPTLDANGYPVALVPGLAVGSMMLRDLRGHYPAGTYTVLYDGDGVLDFWMDDVTAIRRLSAGVVEVDLRPTTGLNNGMYLRIERSNPADPVRNIRVVMPGFLPTYNAFPFYPPFLDFLGNYSTLRMMDLMETNAQTDTMWALRTTPSARTYTVNGMPAEDLVLLANTVGAHLWLNMPHLADDGYITSLATLVFNSLRPDLNVTIEYSNEVWGTLFPGGQYAQTQGLLANADRLSRLSSGSDEARFCWYGMRSRAIFNIWAAVFTGNGARPAARSRLRFVLASQAVNADVSRRILACNGSGLAADALAIAPYVNPFITRGNSGSDLDMLDASVIFNTTFPAAIAALAGQVAQHAAYARMYNLSLVTYESGQAITASTAKQQALAQAVNLDPRIAAVYVNYTNTLFANGVSLAMHFSSIGLGSMYGYWGLVEALDSDPASQPKRIGLSAVVAATRQCAFDSRTSAVASAAAAACPAGMSNGGAVAPCSANGVCVDAPVPGAAGKMCSCFSGYTGAACDVGSFIDFSTCSYQCGGRGSCIVQRTVGRYRYWGCNCTAGYGGDRCTAVTCQQHCSWNGRCVGPNQCACYDGYSGADCSVDCGCGSRGVCAWTRDVVGGAATSAAAALPPSCTCDAGYTFQPSGAVVLAPVNGSVTSANAAYAAGSCVPSCSCPNINQTCVRPGVCSCYPSCVNGDCLNGQCTCWTGFGGRDCSRRLRAGVAAASGLLTSAYSPIGINLGGIAYWSTAMPFLDIMKSSAVWISQYTPDARPSAVYIWDLGPTYPQNLSSDGWPLSLLPGVGLGTLMARDVQQRLPNGRYIVKYDGNGDLRFDFDATIVSQRKGRIEIDVRLSLVRDNGIYMQVTDVDESNPIRNIRVLFPGTEALYDDGLEFHPLFLDSLRNFSAIRMMDFMGTNENRVRQWNDRNVRTESTYGNGHGVPVESMVKLANILGIDPWFNMPASASDEYLRNFATYVRDNLRNDVTIFVERSNEVWNPLFSAGAENYAAAAAAGINGPQMHATVSVRQFRVWADVFGPAARAARLVHVLSTQTVNSWITSTMLTWNNTWQYVDAIGVTAYVDCGGLGSASSAARTAMMTVDAVLDRCDAVRSTLSYSWQSQMNTIASVLASVTAAAAASSATPSPSSTASSTPSRSPSASPSSSVNGSAAPLAAPSPQYGFDLSLLNQPLKPNSGRIPLIVYEGGPGLVDQSAIERGPSYDPPPGLSELLIAANRAPRMATTYRAYLDSFAALGLAGGRGGAFPFMHFSHVGLPSKFGSWGLWEYQSQSTSSSPKASAVMGYINEVVSNLTRRGCTNPAASNFDAAARFSTDTCVFPPTPVGATGGVVAPPSASVSLAFPPGALTAAVPISVATVAAAPAPGAAYLLATTVYSFGPPGTQFVTPITTCIAVNMTDVALFGWSASGDDTPAAGANNLTLALYTSSDGVTWNASDKSYFNASAGTVCGTMWHFTLAAGMRVSATVASADMATSAAVVAATNGGGSATSSSSSGSSSASSAVIGGAVGGALGGVIIVGIIVAVVLRSRARHGALTRHGSNAKVSPDGDNQQLPPGSDKFSHSNPIRNNTAGAPRSSVHSFVPALVEVSSKAAASRV